MTNLLEVRDATKIFRNGPFWARDTTTAVDKVNLILTAEQPSITGIVGESGSGKTTLAMLVLGQLRPDSGSLIFNGTNINAMTPAERRRMRREVQPIYQDPFASFNPFYKVDHALTEPLRNFMLANSRLESERLIHHALELAGLRPAETLGRYPHQLSGGQRQRIMVARALLCKPTLIVADEPVSMLDASLRATILAGLQTLNRELGISILYITHDLTTAYQICDRVLVMYAGSVVEFGTTEHVIREPKHPYTQLLISSIPSVKQTHQWADTVALDVDQISPASPKANSGCKFAPRCHSVMNNCWTTAPPLSQMDTDRAVACLLY